MDKLSHLSSWILVTKGAAFYNIGEEMRKEGP